MIRLLPIVLLSVVACAVASEAAREVEGAAAGQTTNAAEKDSALRLDLRPTYGPLGSERPGTFIAGELLCFAAKVSGIKADNDGRIDGVCDYTLTDASGKVVNRDRAHKSVLPLGGNELTVPFSFPTELSTPPGEYTVHFRFRDYLADRSVEKYAKIKVLHKNTFGIRNLSLYHDSEGRCAAGGNVAPGEVLHATFRVYVPKNEKNEAAVALDMAVYDRNNTPIHGNATYRDTHRGIVENGVEMEFRPCIAISEPGFYRFHVELKDLSTNKVDQRDVPLVVHGSSGPSAEITGPATTRQSAVGRRTDAAVARKDEHALSLDAWPTLGAFGGSRDAMFVQREAMFFTARITGFAVNANHGMDATLTTCLVDPNGSILGKKNVRLDQPLLADRRSLVFGCHAESAWGHAPGRYTFRLVVADRVSNRTATKEMPMTILDADRFDLCGLRLSCDKEGRPLVGPNLTVGDTIFMQGAVYLPKKSDGHDLKVTTSVLDSHGAIMRQDTVTLANVTSAASSPQGLYLGTMPITPNRPGSFRLRYHLTDPVTNDAVTKEIPINVLPPPELPRANE